MDSLQLILPILKSCLDTDMFFMVFFHVLYKQGKDKSMAV